MIGLGYLGYRTATCAGCGRHVPNEDEPLIVWAMSLDGERIDPFCQACVKKYRLKVRERVVPDPNPFRPREPVRCHRCGTALPSTDSAGWTLWVFDEEEFVAMCNACRLAARLPTVLTTGGDATGSSAS